MFQRDEKSKWQKRGSAIPVVVGQQGFGYGRGVADIGTSTAPRKREGDNKSPAGIFRLRYVFGYGGKNPGTKMPYLALNDDIFAVDDPKSRYYNKLVDRSKTNDPDWHHAEKMILKDNRYQWGIFVEHNYPPVPGAGSCIFLHVWKTPTTATTGCTAMPATSLVDLIRWLDPKQVPLLIQMPQSLYNEARKKWDLPAL